MPNRQELSRVLSCTSLPSLPAVGVQVLALTRDPDASLDRIAQLLETDPALSAKVLKTVNSSLYGLKTPCTTIRRALNLLGLSAVKSIVLGFSLVEVGRTEGPTGGFDINAHWRRTIYAAAAARAIAEKVGGMDAEEVFAAALFQDIGVLAMLTALGDRYTQALAPAPHDHAQHADLERAALGFTHCDCGAALASRWRMPDRYVQAILHHHNPDAADADCRAVARAVGLGAMIAAALTSDNPGRHAPAMMATARLWFDLSPPAMAALLKQVGEAAGGVAAMFEKSLGPEPDVASLMQQADEELVRQRINSMREAEELRKANEALARSTVTDQLTGIGNRKRFDEESARLFEESRTIGRPFALLMADADKFKSVNDTHGHHVGDVVLKELARRITEAVGARGVVCRYGGEEFAVLVAGSSMAGATILAERVRKAVDSGPISLAAIPSAPAALPVTISLGVACNDPSGAGAFPCFSELIEAADRALYNAKRAGRNCVCREASPTPSSVPAPHARTEEAPPPAPAEADVEAIAPPAITPTKVKHGARVLLLEDDPLAARMILAVIQKTTGVETEWVRSVSKGVQRLEEARADPAKAVGAVVCDFTLTGGTALDVLPAARNRLGRLRFPFLVISASDEPRIRQQTHTGGASAFMSKDHLVQQLPAWLAGALSDALHTKAA